MFVQKSLSFIENRIKWKASQHNLPNKRVFLFEGLDKKTSAEYLRQINIEDTGEIILLFIDKKGNWTALGTKMIVGYDGIQLNAVAFSAIKNSISKTFHELKSASDKTVKSFRKKDECELMILDKNDAEIVFITHRGSDFFALASIVLMLTRLYSE